MIRARLETWFFAVLTRAVALNMPKLRPSAQMLSGLGWLPEMSNLALSVPWGLSARGAAFAFALLVLGVRP